MRLFLLLIVSSVIFSCTKKDEVNSEFFNGKYKGTYTRGTDTVNVEIEFKDAAFTGSSDTSFPVICSGQVLQQKDVVIFSNTCSVFSIDFLIGNYFYYQKDNYLSFWKSVNGVTVYYRLNK